MATINKQPNGRFKVTVRLKDRSFKSKTFDREADAIAYGRELEQLKDTGFLDSSQYSRITLDDYFPLWLEASRSTAGKQQRYNQSLNFKNHVAPIIGKLRLGNVDIFAIHKVLNRLHDRGLSPQTQRHVYNLLNKMFVDTYKTIKTRVRNPLQDVEKPRVPKREALYLSVEDSIKLLSYCEDKKYGLAIWLQLLLGLRVGELIALEWDRDVDFAAQIIHVHYTYQRFERRIKDYPKGMAQRDVRIPSNESERTLLTKLREAKLASGSKFVICGKTPDKRLPSQQYRATLRSYCQELGITSIGTHGLRHSTSEIYIQDGCNVHDLMLLLGHASSKTTERYMHGHGTNLNRVAQKMTIFSTLGSTPESKSNNQKS